MTRAIPQTIAIDPVLVANIAYAIGNHPEINKAVELLEQRIAENKFKQKNATPLTNLLDLRDQIAYYQVLIEDLENSN